MIRIINLLLRNAACTISAPVSTERERLAEEQRLNEKRQIRWACQYYRHTGRLPKGFHFYGFKRPSEV